MDELEFDQRIMNSDSDSPTSSNRDDRTSANNNPVIISQQATLPKRGAKAYVHFLNSIPFFCFGSDSNPLPSTSFSGVLLAEKVRFQFVFSSAVPGDALVGLQAVFREGKELEAGKVNTRPELLTFGPFVVQQGRTDA